MLVRLCPLLLVACASAGGDPALQPDASLPVDAPKPPADSSVEPPPDSPPQNLCASAATCQNAVSLGSVSGDTLNMKVAPAPGHQSAWFRVRVTEDDSEPLGLTLRVAAKLTSPSTNDYDVFVYVNSGSNVVECATTTGTTTTTGNVNENRTEWGEGFVSNGSDDGRDVSIEVRPIGTNCQPTSFWSLEIEGNWL
jgi:hypothetical protein